MYLCLCVSVYLWMCVCVLPVHSSERLITRLLCSSLVAWQVTTAAAGVCKVIAIVLPRLHTYHINNNNINKIAYKSKADHMRMLAFSYASSLPVLWKKWWSHHLICHSQNPKLHANFMTLCFIEPELMPMHVLHFRNRDFLPFLLWWPWP